MTFHWECAGRGPGAHNHPRQGHVYWYYLQGLLDDVLENTGTRLINDWFELLVILNIRFSGRDLCNPWLRVRHFRVSSYPLLWKPLQVKTCQPKNCRFLWLLLIMASCLINELVFILIHMLFAYLLMYIEVFEDMSSRQYHHILETVRSARGQLYIMAVGQNYSFWFLLDIF